jgi:hypothetical protein
MLLAILGLSANLYGQPLLPIGTYMIPLYAARSMLSFTDSTPVRASLCSERRQV